jgi:hypothetical protein
MCHPKYPFDINILELRAIKKQCMEEVLSPPSLFCLKTPCKFFPPKTPFMGPEAAAEEATTNLTSLFSPLPHFPTFGKLK